MCPLTTNAPRFHYASHLAKISLLFPSSIKVESKSKLIES